MDFNRGNCCLDRERDRRGDGGAEAVVDRDVEGVDPLRVVRRVPQAAGRVSAFGVQV